jgi:hypothetical protein
MKGGKNGNADRIGHVANSWALDSTDAKSRAFGVRRYLARVAQRDSRGDVWVREEINGRFEQIERRMEEGLHATTEQFVEMRAYIEYGYDRLDKALLALSSGITRLERKLDRILALSVEARVRRP